MAIRQVLVSLGGQDRILRCDLAAWADLEDQGRSFNDVVTALTEGRCDFRGIRLLVWALAGTAQPRPTLEEIGHWIDGSNVTAVLAAVGEALTDAFPPGEGNGARPPAAGGTGQPPAASPPISASSLAPSGG